MAEGFLNRLGAGRFEARSAGAEPSALHPLAVQVMADEGVDIGAQHAKSIDAFLQDRFDYVITVCDEANETCPVFPNARHRLHWSFPDPSRVKGTREERLAFFRAVRDAIRARVGEFLTASVREGDRLP
jgi:arsenate reductase